VTALPRPEWEAPDGWELAVEPVPGWRMVTAIKRCRRRRCLHPAIAELNRGAHPSTGNPQWWAYCPCHLADYRDWVQDGQVVHWNMRQKPAGGAS
jgi:hypothetical protein